MLKFFKAVAGDERYDIDEKIIPKQDTSFKSGII